MKNQNRLTSSTGTLHRSRAQLGTDMWLGGGGVADFAKMTVSMKEMTYLRYWSGRGRMSSASSMNACAPNAVRPLVSCHSGRGGKEGRVEADGREETPSEEAGDGGADDRHRGRGEPGPSGGGGAARLRLAVATAAVRRAGAEVISMSFRSSRAMRQRSALRSRGFSRQKAASWRYLGCCGKFHPSVFCCPALRGRRNRPREARAGHRAGTRSATHFSRSGQLRCAIVGGSVSSGTRGGPRGRGAGPGENGGGQGLLHGRAAHDIAHPPTPGPAVRHGAHAGAAERRCRRRPCGPR